MKNIFFLAALSSFMAGCASSPELKAMAEGVEIINIEFINNSPKNPITVISYNDDYDCFGQKITAFAATGFESRTISVPKKPYQTVTFQYLGLKLDGVLVSRTCTGTYSFETSAAGTYKVSFEDAPDNCHTSVQRAGGAERIPLIQRQYERPAFDSAGPWCSADLKFLGSSNFMVPRR